MKTKMHLQMCKYVSGWFLFNNSLYYANNLEIFISDTEHYTWFLILNQNINTIENNFMRSNYYMAGKILFSKALYNYSSWEWKEVKGK